MTLISAFKDILNKLPYISGLYQENHQFKTNSCFPAGHYYSPIVSVADVEKRVASIWESEAVDGISGIDLKKEEQLALVRNFYEYYEEIPFGDHKKDGLRYYFVNDFYLYTDAIILYSMMRHYKPKHIVEVGSGFSSAVMLDTNELFFDKQIKLTFIEPYTERLNTLLNESDKSATTIIQQGVQSVSLEVFDQLEAGDILFIDSTHVVKTGSDVNYIVFEILPRLRSGVLVHFHDIFYPFEYPKEWVLEGRNWNEAYFLKAFLMYNEGFEIKVFSDYLHRHHGEVFDGMPLCFKNSGGNIWLERK